MQLSLCAVLLLIDEKIKKMKKKKILGKDNIDVARLECFIYCIHTSYCSLTGCCSHRYHRHLLLLVQCNEPLPLNYFSFLFALSLSSSLALLFPLRRLNMI